MNTNERDGAFTYRYARPALAVDCVVFGLDEADLKVLLIRRGMEPFLGRWALPGGFVHMDETLDPTVLGVVELAADVLSRRFARGATASHCVSLGMQERDVQLRIAAELAEAGLAVLTLPQTNLYLQGRSHPVATPRVLG